jgi:hypothetical protein
MQKITSTEHLPYAANDVSRRPSDMMAEIRQLP